MEFTPAPPRRFEWCVRLHNQRVELVINGDVYKSVDAYEFLIKSHVDQIESIRNILRAGYNVLANDGFAQIEAACGFLGSLAGRVKQPVPKYLEGAPPARLQGPPLDAREMKRIAFSGGKPDEFERFDENY